MPELPDVAIYIERLEVLVQGQRLSRIRLGNPFILRTVTPAVDAFVGKRLVGLRRLGKRIVFEFESGLFAVVHLMIAGRLHWRPPGAALARKLGLFAFDFETGTLVLTEAGSKRRASLHLVHGEPNLAQFERGGLEPLTASLANFASALQRENRTLKRALTDPTILSGIGNAYSDEILFAAQLSPVKRSQSLTADEVHRLYDATQTTLQQWLDRTRREVGAGFPEKVTAFRPEMAVHGRYNQPCRVCGTLVQRIRFADNELNYCPRCQTAGKLLADRGLSRLLKADFPRTIAELEELKQMSVKR